MQHKDFNVKEEELKLIRFYQNDLNSAKLLINVTHDKVVTDFSSAISVQIAFLKPDCKRVFQDVQNVNQMQGKYYVFLSTQTLIAYGNVIAQLRFTFPNSKVIETCKFAFTVDESIMSDDAMKSTNEFPVIQKAIEAGKKLEGVDIDGIIAAGELANGAVKKSGGTMTGLLEFDVSNGEKAIRGSSEGISRAGISFTKGQLIAYDWGKTRPIFYYDSNDGQFYMQAESNLLRKAGGTMEGHLIFPTNKNLSFITNDGQEIATIAVDGNGNFFAWNNPGNKYLWKLDPSGRLEVHADNLLSKTGGDVSGTIAYTDIFPQVYKKVGKKSWAVHRPDGNSLIFVPEVTAGTSTWDWDKQVEITEHGTVKQANDTYWTDIPLQPNVSNIDGRVTQARRLGGTVSINMTYRAKSLVNNFVMKLPQVFRPDRTIDTHIIDGSGRAARAIVDPDGTVYCSTVNEDIRAIITYTV
ncbi:BppU family phage baseplate upper protein [Bacillus wiedmannii]|uniref:BppU family phage baseplate upper protein n=1 Tax=Bacillus wiedmannii TaxID=1890302 RepID=UPI0020D283C2|nr:BppU family phage baseplate upper protein [Bacillus wiedmannii]